MDQIRDLFLVYQNRQEMATHFLSNGFYQLEDEFKHPAFAVDEIGPIINNGVDGEAIFIDDRHHVNLRCMDPEIDLEVFRKYFSNVKTPKRVFAGGIFLYK